MIEEIIKRNGSAEAFQPQKVNGWGEWAAEHLGDKVDWATVVGNAVVSLPARATSKELQQALIDACLDMRTWSYYRMAGRLYAAMLFKDIYPNGVPTVKALHQRLVGLNMLAKMNYTDDDYAFIEELIDHDRDYHCPHFSLHHGREKYALKNRVTGEEYETQQFMYMRMAMAMSEHEPLDQRRLHLSKFYEHLAGKRLSAPTPNYVDFGTPRPGLASCCLLVTGDDGKSLAITDYIANVMTQSNAGIGVNLITRGIGEPVRNGTIKHLGKWSYIASLGKSILANTKNGRGGAGTLYWNAYDPESELLSQLRNPRQTEDKKNRDLHYNMMSNKFFAMKVAAKDPAERQIFTWSIRTAPELHKAFYSGDIDNFIRIYKALEADPLFRKTYVDARELALTTFNEAFETGTAYLSLMDEMNRHTPFKDTIWSSNLCAEVAEPTNPYYEMAHVYSDREVGVIRFKDACNDDRVITFQASDKVKLTGGPIGKLGATHRSAIDLEEGMVFETPELGNVKVGEILERTEQPEVAMCSLGAIIVDNIENDAQYAEVMYYGYKMIDYTIHNSVYALPHVEFTAKQRMNAGMGMMGVATHMARAKLKYSSLAGKQELHWLAERHMYFAIKASLKISQERGLAPWMHKTKWPQGWTPRQTYNKNVDGIGQFSETYNWDALEAAIIENGGIGHSCLVNYMPGESSSKQCGSTNSNYPIRRLVLKKTDVQNTINWAAPFGDDPAYEYEMAWDVPSKDQIDMYALFQKWTDQGISADFWRRIMGDDKVGSGEMIRDFLYKVKMGLKTSYYQNTETTQGISLADIESAVANHDAADSACATGNCTL